MSEEQKQQLASAEVERRWLELQFLRVLLISSRIPSSALPWRNGVVWAWLQTGVQNPSLNPKPETPELLTPKPLNPGCPKALPKP